jgi:hypothetical protein
MTAEEYLNTIKRADMFPVREAIIKAFNEGMKNAKKKVKIKNNP